MKVYKTVAELLTAYEIGELSKKESPIIVTDDDVSVHKFDGEFDALVFSMNYYEFVHDVFDVYGVCVEYN